MAVRDDMGPHWLGITWSLAVEEQFYLTLPFIIRLVSYRKLSYVIITVIATVPILRALLLFVPPHSLLPGYVLMLSRADALLLGVFVAYAMRRKEIVQYLANHIRWLYGAFGLLLFGVIALAVAGSDSTYFIANAVGYSENALLYACFLLLVLIEERGPVVSVTMNHLLRSLGIIAYGVYLFHEAINYLAHGLILGQSPQLQTGIDLLVSLVALGFTILIAEASWNLFEKRFVAIGHFFRYENPATADKSG